MFAYDQKGVVIVPKESIPDEIDIEELAIEVLQTIPIMHSSCDSV